MPGAIDAFHYVSYMRSRWRLIAASCGIAGVLAVGVSLLQTREYTATARILIEPPAGSDLRAAMAVSPIYLESLRTYEEIAGSDSQFRKAIERFGLRPLLGGRPIESLKKRVLKVRLVRNTRILEIAVVLPDAAKAQALAQFLAESTVELNRSMVSAGDRDLQHGLEDQAAEARTRLDGIETQWARLLAAEPVEDLKASMENSADLRSKLQQDVVNVELEIADSTQPRTDIAAAQSRLAELRKQLQTLDRQTGEREKLLAMRMAHRDKLESERRAAQTGLATMEATLREAHSNSGFRGERLKIVDPGIVPERPSSRALPLNLAAALLLGLVLPILYLAIELNFREHRAIARRDLYQTAVMGRDD